MVFKGQCLCSAVQYSVDDDLKGGVLCLCRTCQVLHTDRSYNVGSKKDKLTITQGQEKITTYEDGAADVGKTVHRSFCSACGTALWSSPDSMPGVLFVKVGPLEQAASIQPESEIYVESQLPALALEKDISQGLKHYEGMMAKEVKVGGA